MPRAAHLAQREVLGLSVRQHIGGRFAIPWVAAFISFPLNVASTVATNLSPESNVTALQWGVVSVAGIAAMVGVLLIAKFTVLRTCAIKPVPIWLVGLIGSAVGAARVPAMDGTLRLMGFAEFGQSTLLIRMLSGALLGFILLPLGAFVTSTVYQFRTQRRALVNDEIAWHQAQMRAEGATAALRVTLVAKVESELSSAIDALERGSPVIGETLQRTGRDLWDAETDSQPRSFRWGQVVMAGLRHNPLPTLLVLIIWAPTAAMNFASYQSSVTTLARVTASCVALVGVFYVGRLWIARRGRSSVGVLTAVLLGSWILTSPVSWWLFSNKPLSEAIPSMIVNAAWLTLVTVISGAAVAAVRSSEAILDELRQKVSEAEIQALAADEELAILRRELGAQLHGPVRSRLNTASAVLQGMAGANDVRVGGELHAALRSLTRVEGQGDSTGSLHQEVARSLDPWEPLLNLHVTCPTATHPQAQSVVVLIEEAVANAYRHGRASEVCVTVVTDESQLRVQVIDNGIGIDSNSEPGLGTRLLDHHTAGRWLRQSRPGGGTVLELIVG
jgi:hypothetical protein